MSEDIKESFNCFKTDDIEKFKTLVPDKVDINAKL